MTVYISYIECDSCGTQMNAGHTASADDLVAIARKKRWLIKGDDDDAAQRHYCPPCAETR